MTLADVRIVPRERHLLAVALALHRLQGFLADEVVVVLGEAGVTELVRRGVVVLDIVRHEAAAEGGIGFVARARQPLAIGLHLVAGIDRRHRRGDPARLQRVGRVGARADLHHAEVLAGFEDRGADLFAFRVGAPHFEARRAGHAVAQRAHLAAGDRDVAHMEELDVRERAAVELLDHVLRVRALDLVAVELADDRLAHRARRRAVVVFGRDIVAAGLGVEFDPVGGRVAADIRELVFGQVEQDAVADHVAVVAAGRELLRLDRR